MRLRPDQNQSAQAVPTFVAGPIRTAEGFVEALERAERIRNDAESADEFDRIAAAVRSAPFVVVGGVVLAKGFVPRVVRAD